MLCIEVFTSNHSTWVAQKDQYADGLSQMHVDILIVCSGSADPL